MSLPELVTAALALSRGDQLRLVNAVVDELGKRNSGPPDRERVLFELLFPPGTVLDLTSPIEAPGVAAGLIGLLERDAAVR